MRPNQNEVHLLLLKSPKRSGGGSGRPALLCSVTWGPSLERQSDQGGGVRGGSELSKAMRNGSWGWCQAEHFPCLQCARTKPATQVSPVGDGERESSWEDNRVFSVTERMLTPRA